MTPPAMAPTETPSEDQSFSSSEDPSVGVGGELLLVDEAVGVDAPEEMGVVLPLAVGVGVLVDKRASRSSVSCLAEGLAESSEENVLFISALPTLAKGSGAVAQHMFICPSFLVHISLQRTQRLASVRPSVPP